jgi:hypothetical protein
VSRRSDFRFEEPQARFLHVTKTEPHCLRTLRAAVTGDSGRDVLGGQVVDVNT